MTSPDTEVRPRRAVWGLAVAVAVVALAGTLVVTELVARALVDTTFLWRDLDYGGIAIPFEPEQQAELLTTEFRVHYAINGFGHRDRAERRLTREPDTPRVLLLGDSFGVGYGVTFEQTFGSRFEEATGIELVNAAKSGGCPLWYVAQARELLPRFQPDLLLVQLFDNDLVDNRQRRKYFGVRVGEPLVDVPRELVEPPGTPWRIAAFEFERSVLNHRFKQLSRWLKGKRLRRYPFVKPGRKPDHPHYTRAQAIEAHGVAFGSDRPWDWRFAFHDPAQREAWRERIAWAEQLLDQLLAEAGARGVPVALLYIPTYEVFLRAPAENPFADAARRVAQRHGATWLDLQQALVPRERPYELYHAYDGHLNDAGHAAVSELLVSALAPRVREARVAGR